MKVLISGVGPAGLCLAYWLKKYGFTPTLVEQAEALRTGGYNLDVRGAATEVLKRMGIYDIASKNATHIQNALLIDRNGRIIQGMSHNLLRHQMNDDLEIMRGKFCQILKDKIPEVEILFGTSIKKISETEHTVQVEFSDNKDRDKSNDNKANKTRQFDCVIGADGLHSNVRRLVFGEESQFLQDFGIYYCIFTIPNFLTLDRTEMQYTEFGRLMAIWSTNGDTNARVSFAFVASTPVEPRNVAAQKKLIHAIFEDMGGEVPKILEMMHHATDFYFDVTGQIHMNQWSSGRVILLGDAAFCPSPSSGQGLSLAIVGAYVLAGELSKAQGNYEVAFACFEKEMREFVRINQHLGIQSAKLFKLQEKNSVLVKLLTKLMNHLPGPLIKWFSHRSTKQVHQAANAITLKDYA